MPLSPIRFSIDLDFINSGQESAVLYGFKVTKFDMNTELFGRQPLRWKLYVTNHPHAHRDLSFPCTIPGGYREPSLRCEIEVELYEREPIKVARLLAHLQTYHIELEFTYEDMGRNSHNSVIIIQESFADFQQRMIQDWKQAKKFDLVTEVLEGNA
jgi:hypothetical protein